MIGALLVLALAAAPAGQESVNSPLPDARLLRFVGEQVSFEAIDCVPYRWGDDDVETDAAGCREDDIQFRARYRVLRTVDGEPGREVEFLSSAWTSHYAESRHALLYVLQSPDGTLLPSGLAVSVYPTDDDGWASCDAERDSEPLDFAGGIVFGRIDGMSPYGIRTLYPASDYAVVGQEVFCLRGRRLPALMDALDQDLARLREQGFPYLPGPGGSPASP